MRFLSLLLVLIPLTATAQSCSTTSPCCQLTITNPNTLPQTTILWRCVGGPTTCSQTALNDAITQQTAGGCGAVNSTWACATFSQTKSPQAYNDPVQYGQLLNYAASGGGAAGPTSISTFQVPPAAQPLGLSGGTTLTTSGTQGPQ